MSVLQAQETANPHPTAAGRDTEFGLVGDIIDRITDIARRPARMLALGRNRFLLQPAFDPKITNHRNRRHPNRRHPNFRGPCPNRRSNSTGVEAEAEPRPDSSSRSRPNRRCPNRRRHKGHRHKARRHKGRPKRRDPSRTQDHSSLVLWRWLEWRQRRV
jgi:hypothetical protein